MADITVQSRIPGKRERFVDLGDDVIAPVVAIATIGGADVVIEGDGVFDTAPVEAGLADVVTAVEAVTAIVATEAKQDAIISVLGDIAALLTTIAANTDPGE